LINRFHFVSKIITRDSTPSTRSSVRVRSLNFLRQTNHAILLVKACTQPPPSTVPPAFAVPPRDAPCGRTMT